VIVRSNTGNTFGGYAAASWHSQSAYVSAAGCFLYLVDNPHGDAPTTFEHQNKGPAIAGFPSHGPVFGSGSGSDICITGNGSSSHTAFPLSYCDTLGRGHATFTGSYNFTPEDYEVWAASAPVHGAPTSVKFSLEALQARSAETAGCDVARLHEYLSDADFLKTFAMSATDFAKLPAQKQADAKKKHRL
jgi:hypothetical protein